MDCTRCGSSTGVITAGMTTDTDPHCIDCGWPGKSNDDNLHIGASMIIALQGLIGIEEPYEIAITNWQNMSYVNRWKTVVAYSINWPNMPVKDVGETK